MSKLILIDGARGHTGTFLVKELLETKSDWNIIATDLPLDERKELMTKEIVFGCNFKHMVEVLEDERVEFIPANLTKPESLKSLFESKKYDIIFHPASLFDYFAPLNILRKINVEGIRNLLEIIGKTQDLERLIFVHWSTCGVYGETKCKKHTKNYPNPSDEISPYNPPNNYIISKMQQELVLQEFVEKYKLKVITIRSAPIIGPYQIYGIFHILKMINKSSFGPGIHIYPKKKRLSMPLIHVEDLVRAAIFLADDNNKAIGEAYNIVLDPCLQEDFLEYIATLLNVNYFNFPICWPIYKIISILIFWISKRKEDKARKLNSRPQFDLATTDYIKHDYLFSNEKIKNLGFKFKFPDYKSATKNTIEWYYKNGWLERESGWRIKGLYWLLRPIKKVIKEREKQKLKE